MLLITAIGASASVAGTRYSNKFSGKLNLGKASPGSPKRKKPRCLVELVPLGDDGRTAVLKKAYCEPVDPGILGCKCGGKIVLVVVVRGDFWCNFSKLQKAGSHGSPAHPTFIYFKSPNVILYFHSRNLTTRLCDILQT